MMNTHYIIKKSLFILAIVVLSSCQQDAGQEEFERQAFTSAQGFTQTNSNGQVINEDPDDWRIGPLFQGLIEVNAVPYANPSVGLQFRFELLVTGLEAVSGLQIYSRDPLGRPFLVYNDNRRPLPPGLIDIALEPSWLTPSRIYSEAIGLNRIFVYDGNDNLITYGDLKVE
jgi:hypothetical protein